MSDAEPPKAPEVAKKPQSAQDEAVKKGGKDESKKPKKDKPTAVAAIALAQLPEFVSHRVNLWKDLKPKKEAELKEKPRKPIQITLPNGTVKEGTSFETTPGDIARFLSKSLFEDAIVAKVNGQYWDLTRPLEDDCALQIFMFDTDEGKHAFWHSSAHVLGQAMEQVYGCHLTIGPPLEEGFYYDAYMGDTIVSQSDFPTLQEIIKKVVAEKQPFERLELTRDEAIEMFKHNKFKLDIIKKIPENERVSAYACGPLIDLCRGPHVPNTGKIKAFEVTKNSAAYWEGKAENESLQRIYGISFPSDKLYKEWKVRMEEAAKRDHRVIGKNQELFFFHELSPGSCFFLPRGARIYNTLCNFIRDEYHKRGFTEVISPNMYNFQLWETSGHAANYRENMFIFEVEKQQFGLKPMNCPGHCLMFDSRPRSYRELPLRMADFGVLHRNELSGTLTGLTRVRRFQQDDAHIFCRRDQIQEEIEGALDFVQFVFGKFGFEFELRLSTRPEHYLGELQVWNDAEAALTVALNKMGRKWEINPGDGAFYGPKIDITVFDALKRRHQLATIQLDFQLPIRFNLQYNTADGEGAENRLTRPVMIHRAVLGSVERSIAILTEHYAGKWPFWLSPRQAIVVPVSDKYNDYADEVRQQIHDAKFFVDVDGSDRKLPKKVREAQLAQYNYILVVGEEEKTKRTVNVRTRDNEVHGERSIPELIADFNNDIANFR